LVGEGSYGRVYYAVLDSGKHVAIKKLDASTEPENGNEFLTQVRSYVFNVTCTSCILLYSVLFVRSALTMYCFLFFLYRYLLPPN
jgi:hypothetical protein